MDRLTTMQFVCMQEGKSAGQAPVIGFEVSRIG